MPIVRSLVLVLLSASFCLAGDADEKYPVTAPPKKLKLDPFYKKYTEAGGYPIVGSARVNDFALKEAAYLVDLMLARRPDVRKAMIESGSRLIVIGHDEFTTDIPEYAHMKPKNFWDARARGLGGSRTDPVCSCAEENVLGYAGDPYSTESIVIHEFAHNIHLRGLIRIDKTFDARLKQAYDRAMERGLWKNKYASTNRNEYFAEGVQSWFNNNRPPDHDHNHVDTRKELKEYDVGLAKLCEEAFGETKLVYTKPVTRLKTTWPATSPQRPRSSSGPIVWRRCDRKSARRLVTVARRSRSPRRQASSNIRPLSFRAGHCSSTSGCLRVSTSRSVTRFGG